MKSVESAAFGLDYSLFSRLSCLRKQAGLFCLTHLERRRMCEMPMRLREPLPNLEGITAWINGDISSEQLAGKPVLVYFWSVSCDICRESLPRLSAWREKLADPFQLNLIGIHMPRSAQDMDIDAVKDAAEQYGIKHPIAVDNQLAVTDAFRNQCVPAYYLFDAQGLMRFYGTGEKTVGMLEQRINKIVGRTRES